MLAKTLLYVVSRTSLSSTNAMSAFWSTVSYFLFISRISFSRANSACNFYRPNIIGGNKHRKRSNVWEKANLERQTLSLCSFNNSVFCFCSLSNVPWNSLTDCGTWDWVSWEASGGWEFRRERGTFVRLFDAVCAVCRPCSSCSTLIYCR